MPPSSLTTSDSTVAPFSSPRVRRVLTRYEQPSPCRTWLVQAGSSVAPRPRPAAVNCRAPQTPLRRIADVFRSMVLPSQNARCDEDQQLTPRVGERVALEQPLQDRHAVEHRRAIVGRLFLADE